MKTRGAVLYEMQPAPLDPKDERLNPNGGAIALGHPLGASGRGALPPWYTRCAGRRPAVRYGVAMMCIGVGQGIAMVVERGG